MSNTKTIIMKGKTVEEAIEAGLKVLGISRENAEIKVISEGKAGVLGVFGAEEAEVEIGPKISIGEEAKEILAAILDRMGFVTLVSLVSGAEDSPFLEIKGDDLGRIIGKEGTTLEALGLLVSSMLSRRHARKIRVIVDAAGYREKKRGKLERMADEATEEAIASGREVILPPMSAADRRAIHLAIAARQKAKSFSRGEGGLRRVVVAPKEPTASGPEEK